MINEAELLLNQEIKVTDHSTQFCGQTGHVNAIMADGRTLDIRLASGKLVLLDVTLVSEIQEPYNWPKQEQSLGPYANHLIKDTL